MFRSDRHKNARCLTEAHSIMNLLHNLRRIFCYGGYWKNTAWDHLSNLRRRGGNSTVVMLNPINELFKRLLLEVRLSLHLKFSHLIKENFYKNNHACIQYNSKYRVVHFTLRKKAQEII